MIEGGIVKWTEYEEQYKEALDWLSKTEKLVQSFNKLQNNLEQKKVVLEEFQVIIITKINRDSYHSGLYHRTVNAIVIDLMQYIL